jgi:TonB family protein
MYSPFRTYSRTQGFGSRNRRIKLSALQMAFGVSILTHALAVSVAASLIWGFGHGPGGDGSVSGRAAESNLETLILLESPPVRAPNENLAKAQNIARQPAEVIPNSEDPAFMKEWLRDWNANTPADVGLPNPGMPADLPSFAERTSETVSEQLGGSSGDAKQLEWQSELESLLGSVGQFVGAESGKPGAPTAGTALANPTVKSGGMSRGRSAAYLFSPKPDYPKAARQRGEQGTVLLRVLVTPEGWPARVEVQESSGFELLDNAARAALRRWRFAPGIEGDQRVASHIEVPIQFTLVTSN